MAKKLVRILSAVNAANVSKSGGYYLIKGVCGAVDGIVMNSVLYPGEQLAAGVKTLEGKPAPAGHPKNAAGQAISALNGEALASAWIGSYCVNARHEGGRSLVDIKVNEKQARAHEQGDLLCNRLDAAIDGTNAEPVHVSTGLFFEPIATNGEAGGKKYSRIATNLQYDHLAILLNERGAGTPDDGVGMFLNEAGQPEPVEEFTLNTEPEDKRSTGLLGWLKNLMAANGADVSFDQIYEGLRAGLPSERCWMREVFDRYAVWTDGDGKLFRQDYSVASDGSVSFTGTAQEVTRKVSYQPITSNQEVDHVKDKILAALNAAGIKTEGLDETALLTAYNALVAKPTEEKLNAANGQLAQLTANARAAEEAELDQLATNMASDVLSKDDLKKLGLARLKEIQANATATGAKAAPVVVGNTDTKGGSKYAGYSINEIVKEAK